MLKIKDGIDLKELERFGFKAGKYFADCKERFIKNEEDYKDYFKVLLDNKGRVLYSEEQFDKVLMSIRVERQFNNILWIEVVPYFSRNTEGWELDMITDTLFDLEQADLIEKEKQD